MAELSSFIELLERHANTCILVEGKNDVAALRALGFTNVQELGREPLYKVVERFCSGETVDLAFDLDKTGNALYAQVRSDLLQRGVRVTDNLRAALRKTSIRQFECLR